VDERAGSISLYARFRGSSIAILVKSGLILG